MCLIFKIGESLFVFETVCDFGRGDSKRFVSEILLACVEVCYGLRETMHNVPVG